MKHHLLVTLLGFNKTTLVPQSTGTQELRSHLHESTVLKNTTFLFWSVVSSHQYVQPGYVIESTPTINLKLFCVVPCLPKSLTHLPIQTKLSEVTFYMDQIHHQGFQNILCPLGTEADSSMYWLAVCILLPSSQRLSCVRLRKRVTSSTALISWQWIQSSRTRVPTCGTQGKWTSTEPGWSSLGSKAEDNLASYCLHQASLVAQTVKNPPAVWETWVRSLGWKDPLEEGMATHSSILAWRILWTEGPGGLPSMGSQRVRHDWATKHSTALSLSPLFPSNLGFLILHYGWPICCLRL